MRGEAIEMVRRIHDASGRQDTPAAPSLIDPAVEIGYRGVVPDAACSHRGYEGIRIGRAWTVRGGRSARWEVHRDLEEAARAAGIEGHLDGDPIARRVDVEPWD